MNPLSILLATQVPHPDPLPLAGPSWLFSLLLLLSFFLHVLLMNLVLGGSITAALARLKGVRHGLSRNHLELSHTLTQILPVAIAFAITFGVASLLFAQTLYGRFLFTSSILMGWYWLSVVPLLILAYYGAYFAAFRKDNCGWNVLAATSLSACLFLVIAFIYSNNMSLMLLPERFLSKYLASPGDLGLNLDDSTLVPRYLHMLVGALAVTGLFTALLGTLRRRKEPEFGEWATRKGLVLFAGATCLNLLVGTWFLLSFSREVLLQFVTSQPLGMTALAIGIVFGLATLGCVVLALQSEKAALLAYGAAVALMFTLISMILVRDQIRRAALSVMIAPAQWEVPEWTLILLFFLLVGMSVTTIFWMLKQLRC